MDSDYLTEWFLYFFLFIFSAMHVLSSNKNVKNENIKSLNLIVTSGIIIIA